MPSLLRSSGEHGLYWLTIALSRGMGLVTVPVYVRLLGPADFGRYELLVSLLPLLYSMLFVGLDFAVSTRYFARDANGRRTDIASAYVITGILSVGAAVAMVLCAPLLAERILGASSLAPAVALAAVAVPLNVLSGMAGVVFRLQFRPRAFFVVTLSSGAIGAVCGVILVVVAGAGLTGAIAGVTVAYAVAAGCGLAATGRSWSVRDVTRHDAGTLLAVGLPLVPAGAAAWVVASSDRLFVAGLAGFDQLGMYAAAARASSLLVIAQTGLVLAWTPLALRWATEADREHLYEQSLRFVAKAGGAAVLVMATIATPLVLVLGGSQYLPVVPVVSVLSGATLLLAMSTVAAIGLQITRRSGRLSAALLAAALGNIGLNLLLIPVAGYPGAAVATLAAYGLQFVVTYFVASRALRMRLGVTVSSLWAASAIVAAVMVSLVGSLILSLSVLILAAVIAITTMRDFLRNVGAERLTAILATDASAAASPPAIPHPIESV